MGLSDEELANLKAGTPRFDRAAGGWRVSRHVLEALESCGRQIGCDIDVVLRAAETGQLGRLIEARGGRRTASTGRNLRRTLALKDQLYRRRVLAEKMV